ncbi:MAG TPA: response regulator [Pyrinomonadaceae bacterium]|jgi:DNA-binding response OmpR family regulator
MPKIVIVEDNTLIAKLYENKLLAEGHAVKVAADGASGFRLIKEFKPDAVLLDLMLPGMSGIEIIKGLRKNWEFTNVPILAYSGGDNDLLDAATEAGTTFIVSKNENSLKEILAHLNDLLELTQNWQIYNSYEYGYENDAASETEKKPATAGERVLIVEDDLLIVTVVRDIVEKAGYQPVVAGDGREAYSILAADANFAAGIFDVHVPYIEGTDLVRHMRTEKRLMKIPVIIMTSEESFKIQMDSLSAGASVFLPKPFERKTFESMFKALVGE